MQGVLPMPLAGVPGVTLLSIVSGALFPFFSTADAACTLSLICREFLTTVRDHPWKDEKTVIKGRIQDWRACFPRARTANVSELAWVFGHRRTPVVDADFVHFEGIQTLIMRGCLQVTDAALVRLVGILSLNIEYCTQITDAAFVHLKGIQTLNMCDCTQITDAAFVHLKGVQTLNMGGCTQITDAAFVHFEGIQTLQMSDCNQTSITDAAFAHIKGVQTLHLEACNQDTITTAAFQHFEGTGLQKLSVTRYHEAAALAAGIPAEVLENEEKAVEDEEEEAV